MAWQGTQTQLLSCVLSVYEECPGVTPKTGRRQLGRAPAVQMYLKGLYDKKNTTRAQSTCGSRDRPAKRCVMEDPVFNRFLLAGLSHWVHGLGDDDDAGIASRPGPGLVIGGLPPRLLFSLYILSTASTRHDMAQCRQTSAIGLIERVYY